MMNVLLPQTEKEFTTHSYWKTFFERNSSFEWYGDYQKLGVLFEKYIKPTDAILQIGCGNSTLAEELYDNGFRNVLSIDTDSNVIVKQKNRNSIKRPTLRFENCSASNISVANASINVCIDKGTLDALLPSESSADDSQLVESMFAEVARCLANFGRYIIVTLAQEHIVAKLLAYFGAANAQFMIRFHRCDLTEKDFVMPVFVVIITKLKMPLNQQRKFEFSNGITMQTENVPSGDKLVQKVKAAQQINWLKHYVTRGPVEETSLRIYAVDGMERYELIIVDDLTAKTLLKYGVFIVPFGREHDWIFATPKGRNILRKNCNLHRLIVVRLSREQNFASLEQIQGELDSIVLDFQPRTCSTYRINYLSLGATNVSQSVEAGVSAVSGKWTVEHVTVDGLMYRRLIFTDSLNLIQSEAEVKETTNGQWHIDWSTNPLCCEHHRHMMVALEFLCASDGARIGTRNALQLQLNFAVLGLGGGILSKVLSDTFSEAKIVGVEIDAAVRDIAVKHFDFSTNLERICTRICDALEFLEESAKPEATEKYDTIFVDLSGPVNAHGLYCPPPQFVTKETLTLMRNSLTFGGVLTLNLVTRDDQLAETVKHTISSVFESVFFIRGDEDINEVILCSKLSPDKFLHLTASSTREKSNNKKQGKKSGKRRFVVDQQNAQNDDSSSSSKTKIPHWLEKCINNESVKINQFTHIV